MAYQHASYARGPPQTQYQGSVPGGYSSGPGAGLPGPQEDYYGNDGQWYPEPHAVHGLGGPAMRVQNQRRPPPPSQGYQHDPMPGLQRGMRSMTFESNPSSNQDPTAAEYRGRGYGEETHGSRYAAPRQPPGGWDQSQAGPPPRMIGAMGRGGDPTFEQMEHRLQPGYDPRWTPEPEYRGYDDYSQGQPQNPIQSIQRSTTMPSNVHYSQNGPPNREPGISSPQDPQYPCVGDGQGVRRVPQPEYPRESVGAFLDSYYDASESEPQLLAGGNAAHAPPLDLTSDIDARGNPVAQSTAGGAGTSQKMNFSRPQPLAQHRTQMPLNPPLFQPSRGLPQQMQKVHSQPDLRNGVVGNSVYEQGASSSVYERPVELAGDAPSVTGYSAYNQGRSVQPMPPVMVNSPVSESGAIRYPRRVDSVPQRLGSVPPSNFTSRTENPLSKHPGSEVLGLQSQYQNPNFRLPVHPPPVRPGLVNDGSHPPPQRQYDVEPTITPMPAEQGPVTHQELEQLSNAVKLNPSDPKLHLTYAKKLVEAATVLASDGGRADVKTTRKNRENYIYEAHKIIKKLTNTSNPYPEAIFYLASCYGEGLLGLQIDHEKAYNLYQSAAKLGHGPSAYRTAVCSELGAGVRRDPAKAITWYKKAAAIGETPAMFKLGMIQWKGLLGQPRNPRDGLIWLKRAADQADENNQHALHELALIYERPEGSDVVIRDVNYARELFQKAAELGYPASQFRMGSAFEYGTMGCPIDPKKSIAWYSKAAMKGDLESQLALSGWYLTGSDGVLQQSDTEAYLWARKAAERGLAKAEYALGYFTEVGIGVPGNMEEAKRWYYKAASQGHPKAQTRLLELKRGGSAAAQKSRERLSRSNVKQKDEGDCVVM